MSNAEMDALRAQLAANPRPTDMAERRARINALGSQYTIPADVRIEAVSANGVAAEWTTTPSADPSCVVMFLAVDRSGTGRRDDDDEGRD